jgi:hypothetical protein
MVSYTNQAQLRRVQIAWEGSSTHLPDTRLRGVGVERRGVDTGWGMLSLGVSSSTRWLGSFPAELSLREMQEDPVDCAPADCGEAACRGGGRSEERG